jgi:hypothetical protein
MSSVPLCRGYRNEWCGNKRNSQARPFFCLQSDDEFTGTVAVRWHHPVLAGQIAPLITECESRQTAAAMLAITRFKLLYTDWRGYMVSPFALFWMAKVYMGAFANLRLDIHHERIEIKSNNLELQSQQEQMHSNRAT